MPKRVGAILSKVAYGSKQFLGLLSLPTVAALAGTALSVAGLWMVYPPLALILPGLSLLGGSLWLALPAKRQRE